MKNPLKLRMFFALWKPPYDAILMAVPQAMFGNEFSCQRIG